TDPGLSQPDTNISMQNTKNRDSESLSFREMLLVMLCNKILTIFFRILRFRQFPHSKWQIYRKPLLVNLEFSWVKFQVPRKDRPVALKGNCLRQHEPYNLNRWYVSQRFHHQYDCPSQ